MRYVITVDYEIEADSEEQALEWLCERDFDMHKVETPLTEEEDE